MADRKRSEDGKQETEVAVDRDGTAQINDAGAHGLDGNPDHGASGGTRVRQSPEEIAPTEKTGKDKGETS